MAWDDTKTDLVDILYATDWNNLVAAVKAGGSSATHNGLDEIQGGTTNEYYHLDSTSYASVVRWDVAGSPTYVAVSGFASNAALLGGASSDTFAAAAHTHAHNDTTSLQGGQSGQYYHLNALSYASVVTWDIGGTQTYVNTSGYATISGFASNAALLGGASSDTFAAAGHNHNHNDLDNIDGSTYHLDATAYGSVNGWNVAPLVHSHTYVDVSGYATISGYATECGSATTSVTSDYAEYSSYSVAATTADYASNCAYATDCGTATDADTVDSFHAASFVQSTTARMLTLGVGGGIVPDTSGATVYQTETTTNKINYLYADFASSATLNLLFFYDMPQTWNNGVLNAYYSWTSIAGEGDVAWIASATTLGDNVGIDTTFGTAVVTADTYQTASALHVSALSGDITAWNRGKMLVLKVQRDNANASDTFTGDARLMSVRLKYTVTATTE